MIGIALMTSSLGTSGIADVGFQFFQAQIDHRYAILAELEQKVDPFHIQHPVGATRRLGPLYGLGRHELVLAKENGALLGLDCENGTVFEVDWVGRRIVEESFGQWLKMVRAE